MFGNTLHLYLQLRVWPDTDLEDVFGNTLHLFQFRVWTDTDLEDKDSGEDEGAVPGCLLQRV